MNIRSRLSRSLVALFAIALVAPAPLAFAAVDEEYDEYADAPASSRVARIVHMEGTASLRQSSSSDWQDVTRNTPVFPGDEVYTAENSRMEIQLGGGRFLRLAEQTDVVFAQLDLTTARIELPAGSAIISVERFDDGEEQFEINAPAAAIRIRKAGVYRIDVNEDGDTRVAVRHGRAEGRGVEQSLDIEGDEVAFFSYNDPSNVEVSRLLGSDDFDSWSKGRDDYFGGYYSKSTPVSSLLYRNDIYGLAELAAYGSWFSFGNYGQCWRPSVGSGWQPYSDGYWQYYPGYGYTWVSNEPWGWAPYHNGRWLFDSSYGWIWVPWSQYAGGSYSWYPSQVYWYQYPGYGYGWVPLAPNEPNVSYYSLARRHRNYSDFVPVNLRNRRGMGVAPLPGNSARLRPIRDGRDVGTRKPVLAPPNKPARLELDKPRFNPQRAEGLRRKPVVVTDPTAARVKPRGDVVGQVEARPLKPAAPAGARVKQGTKPEAGGGARVPEMVDRRDTPERKPVVRQPAGAARRANDDASPRREVDASKPDDAPRRVEPMRQEDRPKPGRVERVDPPANNDADRGDSPRRKPEREPRVEREQRVERVRPAEPSTQRREQEPPRRSPDPPRQYEERPRREQPPSPPPARIERQERPPVMEQPRVEAPRERRRPN
jgi:hypothetical protein